LIGAVDAALKLVKVDKPPKELQQREADAFTLRRVGLLDAQALEYVCGEPL